MMNRLLIRIFFATVLFLYSANLLLVAQSDFALAQLNYERVRMAKSQEYYVRTEFDKKDIPFPPQEIYLRAFKKEGTLEVWAKNATGTFAKIKEYTICVSSGKLGPKRRRGDNQVPEGFYHIMDFNPVSDYFLSLGVSYPNQSDRILGSGDLGGDIYVHGDCVSAGCIPLTNEKMKELYWLAVLAHDNGQQNIPIHIFPYKFKNMKFHQLEIAKHASDAKLLNFWDNLRQGYDFFESTRTLPTIQVNSDGSYGFH